MNIRYTKYQEGGDPEELLLTDLPKKWQTKLLKVLKEHTRKRTLS